MSGELFHYLDRYKKIKIPNESVRKEAQKIILARFKEDLPLSGIRLIKGVLYIKASGVLKSEILMEKEKILSNLRETLGKEAPKNIK